MGIGFKPGTGVDPLVDLVDILLLLDARLRHIWGGTPDLWCLTRSRKRSGKRYASLEGGMRTDMISQRPREQVFNNSQVGNRNCELVSEVFRPDGSLARQSR